MADPRTRRAGAWAVVALAFMLTQGRATAQSTTTTTTAFVLSQPLQATPPSCDQLLPLDPRVSIVDNVRIRWVYDSTLQVYRSYRGRCSAQGLADASLVEGSPFKAQLSWAGTTTAIIHGFPSPESYALAAGPAIVLSGPGSASDANVSFTDQGASRADTGFRIVGAPVVAPPGKLNFDIHCYQLTITKSGDGSDQIAVLDYREVIYREDPDTGAATPTDTACPPADSSISTATTPTNRTPAGGPCTPCGGCRTQDGTGPGSPGVPGTCSVTVNGVRCTQSYTAVSTVSSHGILCAYDCSNGAGCVFLATQIVTTVSTRYIASGPPVCPPPQCADRAFQLIRNGLPLSFYHFPAVAVGGIENAVHTLDFKVICGNPTVPWTLMLICPNGVSVNSRVKNGSVTILPGQSKTFTGEQTFTFSSGDTPWLAVVQLSELGQPNKYFSILSIVPTLNVFPTQNVDPFCTESPGTGRVMLIAGDTPVPGHTIQPSAEKSDGAPAPVTLSGSVVSGTDSNGTDFSFTSHDSTPFRLRATDTTVFTLQGQFPTFTVGPHLTATTNLLTPCDAFKLIVSGDGLPDDTPKVANLAAGGLNDSVHRRSFAIQSTGQTLDGAMVLSFNGTGSRLPYVQLSNGGILPLGPGVLFNGNMSGTLISGDGVGNCTLTVTANGTVRSQAFAIVAGDLILPSTICPGIHRETVALKYKGVAIPGHLINVNLASPPQPLQAFVGISGVPVVSTNDPANPATFMADYERVTSVTLVATDLTVFLDFVTHPTAMVLQKPSASPAINAILQDPASADCPNTPRFTLDATGIDADKTHWSIAGYNSCGFFGVLDSFDGSVFSPTTIRPGDYTVRATARSPCDERIDKTLDVHVKNQLPVVSVRAVVKGKSFDALSVPEVAVVTGTNVSLDASASTDCENDRDHVPLTYEWVTVSACGCGGSLAVKAAAFTVSAADGTTLVQLTVRDQDCGSVVKTIVIRGISKSHKPGPGLDCIDPTNTLADANNSGLPNVVTSLVGLEFARMPIDPVSYDNYHPFMGASGSSAGAASGSAYIVDHPAGWGSLHPTEPQTDRPSG